MSVHVILLDELERYALTELVNIGVSRAAANLRKMVGEQVLLSVPSVEVVTARVGVDGQRPPEGGGLAAVRKEYEGGFSGRARLILPKSNSMALVHAVTGGALSAEDAADMENEALAETGNVVLNSCLATMANMLQQPLTMSLPEVICGNGSTFFNMSPTTADDGGVVLFLYINFAINDRDIRGYIAMLMDLPSLQALKALIADFIERVVGDVV